MDDADDSSSEESVIEIVSGAKVSYVKVSDYQEEKPKEWILDARTLRQMNRHASKDVRQTARATGPTAQQRNINYAEESDTETLTDDDEEFKEPPKRTKKPRNVSVQKRRKVSNRTTSRAVPLRTSPSGSSSRYHSNSPAIAQTTESTGLAVKMPESDVKDHVLNDLRQTNIHPETRGRPHLAGIVKELQSLQSDFFAKYNSEYYREGSLISMAYLFPYLIPTCRRSMLIF